jgi:hypothetical protein
MCSFVPLSHAFETSLSYLSCVAHLRYASVLVPRAARFISSTTMKEVGKRKASSSPNAGSSPLSQKERKTEMSSAGSEKVVPKIAPIFRESCRSYLFGRLIFFHVVFLCLTYHDIHLLYSPHAASEESEG